MIDRICISINNSCNLKCQYCHFREKVGAVHAGSMDVHQILSNVRTYICKYGIKGFKIGFVGNGEPLLSYPRLVSYIEQIADLLEDETIKAYTITNGTVVTEAMIRFFVEHKVNLGFSLDGPKAIHDKLRDGSFEDVIRAIDLYKRVVGVYPTINTTVGREIIQAADEVIDFLSHFGSRITFSRMFGGHQISLFDYQSFISKARSRLKIRVGGLDCAMYGGRCGAGLNNFYFANGKVWLCGNCVDLPPLCNSDVLIDDIPITQMNMDRAKCFKENRL